MEISRPSSPAGTASLSPLDPGVFASVTVGAVVDFFGAVVDFLNRMDTHGLSTDH